VIPLEESLPAFWGDVTLVYLEALMWMRAFLRTDWVSNGGYGSWQLVMHGSGMRHRVDAFCMRHLVTLCASRHSCGCAPSCAPTGWVETRCQPGNPGLELFALDCLPLMVDGRFGCLRSPAQCFH
jgi:hypothetical protein